IVPRFRILQSHIEEAIRLRLIGKVRSVGHMTAPERADHISDRAAPLDIPVRLRRCAPRGSADQRKHKRPDAKPAFDVHINLPVIVRTNLRGSSYLAFAIPTSNIGRREDIPHSYNSLFEGISIVGRA